ncbi:MAG TPA: tRNA lysidine(34) synthetase TilS [Thermoanaerobaculia bacterium]|nr:tRNA lysidine(34) synthetase TilS [Thermoanaerobaculia bacterium]
MDAVTTALERAAASGLTPPGATILLAVSGGADSTALLFAAAEVAEAYGWRLVAAHVHHGWRGREADRDALFVADHARRLGLPFLLRRRDARAASGDLGLSPEAGARRVRYEALLEMAREAGASRIATAHHREDRVESYLLARARKGGIASLAGPREIRADGVVRPLLSVSRSDIVRYLRARGVSWRRDRTNGDLALDRNRLRHRLESKERDPLARRVEELARLRDRLDGEFERNLRPRIVVGRNVVMADARLFESSPAELVRRAIFECATPFAAEGKPPMTGREREQILRLVKSGEDFRFEAGRRIRFRRRGARFEVRLAPAAAAGKKGNNRIAGSVILDDRRESMG